ncbi:MAG: hypothetical protein KAH32_08280 [Chlamydiia bacterium]|nr:hypothetical protein [Chlamydiia bacterium]
MYDEYNDINEEAKDAFTEIVTSENFMTPDIMDYFLKENYAIELASGYAMEDTMIFGVTVANTSTGEHEHDMSMSFTSESLAMEYINSFEE